MIKADILIYSVFASVKQPSADDIGSFSQYSTRICVPVLSFIGRLHHGVCYCMSVEFVQVQRLGHLDMIFKVTKVDPCIDGTFNAQMQLVHHKRNKVYFTVIDYRVLWNRVLRMRLTMSSQVFVSLRFH